MLEKTGVARLPILRISDQAVFPGCRASASIHTLHGMSAIDVALRGSRWLVLAGPAYCRQNRNVAVIASVAAASQPGGAGVKIELTGGRRIVLPGVGEDVYCDRFEILQGSPHDAAELAALLVRVQALWRQWARLQATPVFPMGSAERQIDWMASRLKLDVEQSWGLVREADPLVRARLVHEVLAHEIEGAATRTDFRAESAAHMHSVSRRELLRHQLQWTENELIDIEERPLRRRLQALQLPGNVLASCRMALRRLHGSFDEAVSARGYLEFVSGFPWADPVPRHRARLQPGACNTVWGGPHVQERIADLSAQEREHPAICFAGPPGVGKTFLAAQLARQEGLAFAAIPLGGVRGDAMLRGVSPGRSDATPGRILAAIQAAGTHELVILLDDIDKVEDNDGNVWAALLEILDPLQRRTFFDRYLGHPVDLSRTWFIVAANDPGQLPSGLRDRLEVVWLRGYDDQEKNTILQQSLWPHVVQAVSRPQLRLAPGAAKALLQACSPEAGVRELERKAALLARRWVRDAKPRGVEKVSRRFALSVLEAKTERLAADATGRVFGLAWTPLGGTVMPVEIVMLQGEGGVRVTGRVGEVMGESIQAAYTWIRLHGHSLGVPAEMAARAMHVHFPEAATPKDGPSAGLTLIAGMLSAMLGQMPLPKAAFTGEITILGEVLPVGGIREKLLAALRSGIKTVVLPEANRKDVRLLSAADRKRLNMHYVRRLDEFVAILRT